ncbi:PH domain-containing protein [Actinoplanes utahensis]|uniref:Membrane protein n=1 Tax=Actinoplanes utahensis TaxID=1869 RepID=A0A0A6UH01_ACTUT|nr:PH domain-containing protein [Actinoplanes utahensis]KHD75285.1 membrane protein [Actinoplanes utahensis]GIF30462.1 membrane protein [Actinoplanes utahensis]
MASRSAPADIRLRLRPPRRRLDRRFILWQTLQAVFWGAGVLGVLGGLFWYAESWRPWLLPIIGVAAVTFAVEITIMPTWHFRVHRWEATDDAVYALTGSFTRKWQIVPISRIQSIDTEIGPLQRRLGLATITVTTASSEGKISIEGVNAAEAEVTVDRLREITGASEGDAT